jgi:hypothetical protein
MGWKVWGEPFETNDLTSTLRVFQLVKPNKNLILRAIRCWYIFYGDPVFTNLFAEIFSIENNEPKKKLFTSSNLITNSEIISLENGVKEIYFTFNDVNLKSNTQYAFLTRGNGYTGSSSSHIAWKTSFPDPVYTTNLTLSYENLLRYPYTITFFGSEI